MSIEAQTLIVTPTYNEAENLPDLLKAIHEVVPDVHILVVDDNSPDGTGQLAESIAAEDERVHVLRRAGKLGLGTAYMDGFRWGLAREYNYFFEMDADFSHQPKYLLDFMAAAEEHGLVLGSRRIPGGGVEDWGAGRRFLSWGGTTYAKVILGLAYSDLTGGFKCFRREVLEALDFDTVKSEGYAFQIELTWRAHRKGFSIGEVPIIFPDRKVGQSKMSKKVFMEAVFMVWRLRFSSWGR